MCGIVGYIGPRTAQDFLLEGLRRLEYRGYDSAGTATITADAQLNICLLYTSPSPRDATLSRMPSSA